MFMTTVNAFPGYNIVACHGAVFGSSTAFVGVKGAAGLAVKWVKGGNADSLQAAINEIRDAALKNMCDAAAQKGPMRLSVYPLKYKRSASNSPGPIATAPR